jgi:hypothetical protein
VVLLDSDMIVTSSLDDLITPAAAGRIAVHPDHEITRERQFPEWASTFELEAPLRPQRYVNAAPVAFLARSLAEIPRALAPGMRAATRRLADPRDVRALRSGGSGCSQCSSHE